MKNFFKMTALRSAVYFTIAVTLFSLAVIFTNSGAEALALDPSRVLCLLPFCICFAVANTTMKYKNIEAFTRWLIHAALTVIGAFLFIILPAGFEQSSGKFMGFMIVAVVYGIGVLIYAIFAVRVKNAINEDKKLKKK